MISIPQRIPMQITSVYVPEFFLSINESVRLNKVTPIHIFVSSGFLRQQASLVFADLLCLMDLYVTIEPISSSLYLRGRPVELRLDANSLQL